MKKIINYESVYKDWQYLFNIGDAYDMDGGYEQSRDLFKLLKKPNKSQARQCLINQMRYWFEVGPESFQGGKSNSELEEALKDCKVRAIKEKYNF